MENPGILHKMVGGLQIATLQAVIASRTDNQPLFTQLRAACGDAICGPAMTLFHYGSVKEGILVEAAFPVKHKVESGNVHTRTLEARFAWTLIHSGAHDTLRATTQSILEHVRSHAGTLGGSTREIYLRVDHDHPENNLTEVQVMDHCWHERLATSVDEVLGPVAARKVMMGINAISVDSSAQEYRQWVHAAMSRIDDLTSDTEKKFRMLSCCAHVFPQYRIDRLHTIYEQHHEVDDVLREMYQDPDWYEDPARKGNQLFIRKVPFDADGYKSATDPAIRRQAYCHCAFVQPYLTEAPASISPTFCWCGAGWYCRLWEGILGQPIRVEHVETLVTGGDCCKLIITLPITAEGEFTPEMARTEVLGNTIN